MNSKRSYLDTLNAGRQRRPQTTLEQLNRSLETLEQRLEQTREEVTARPLRAIRRRPALSPARAIAEPRYPAAQPTGQQRWYEDPQPAPRPQNPAPAPAFDQNYQAIARDIDRVRGQEDGVAMVGKIAGELRGMREELRHQMTAGLQREFDALRKDIDRAFQANASPARQARAAPNSASNSNGFPAPSRRCRRRATTEASTCCGWSWSRSRPRSTRWRARRACRRSTAAGTISTAAGSAFEDRVDADQRKRSDDPGLSALTDRLEQISNAVNNLPESLSLRSLEEKVRTLAGAVDHFASQQDNRGSETLRP